MCKFSQESTDAVLQMMRWEVDSCSPLQLLPMLPAELKNLSRDRSPGTYYLRYCQGSTLRCTKAGDTYDEAEMAQIFIVPEGIAPEKSHRIGDLIAHTLPISV